MKVIILATLPVLAVLAAPAPAADPVEITGPSGADMAVISSLEPDHVDKGGVTLGSIVPDDDLPTPPEGFIDDKEAELAFPLNTTFDAAEAILRRQTDAPYKIKKGLAYNNGAITNVLSKPGSATWAYNWGAAMNAPKFQQIPMCWGLGSGCDANGINNKISKGDTPWVLGYNEPDETNANGGCNASPKKAADNWGKDMFRFQTRGPKLVCPAVSSWNTDKGHTGGPAGLQWLRQFVKSASSPSYFRCGAQALHWYGAQGESAARQAQLFIDYIAYAHVEVDKMYGKTMPIWVTEFSPLPVGNVNMMADFLKIVIPWMNKQSWIHRYSPFMAEHLVINGKLNRAGNVFVDTK
ncbi:hypothetical protein RB597_007082 [Gaeumannomyces tritici]